MKYEISGKVMQVVTLTLNPGETVVTQAGGMTWMTDNFHMETNMAGGLLGGFKRALAGESMFLTRYTCYRDMGQIAFSAGFPGNIIPLHLEPGQQMICQKGAFLCSEESVQLGIHFRKKLARGLFGGEGFILKVSRTRLCLLEIDGEVIERNLGLTKSSRWIRDMWPCSNQQSVSMWNWSRGSPTCFSAANISSRCCGPRTCGSRPCRW